jgi:putative tryptophan/tyrosine transport system substrate-binding protein
MKFQISAQILKSLFGLIACFSMEQACAAPKTVAITQIAPHPSLDQIRRGVEDELRQYDPSIKIIFDNAQGNVATATQIAQKFLSLDVDAVVPITTPSAQTMCSVFKNASTPIVFAAVTDPYRAKVVIKDTPSSITGVSDRPPLKQQLQLMKQVIPKLGKVGILYNAGEVNSQSTVDELKELAKEYQLEIVEGACSQSSEVSSVALNLVEKVDALFIPNDNLVISALDAVLKVAQGKKPVFALDPESVTKGCLAAAAYDQYEMGRDVGKIVVRILQGEALQAIPVETPNQVKTSVNLTTAKALGITIPDAILTQVSQIIGE